MRPCCFWAPASPRAGQAGPAAEGVADRGGSGRAPGRAATGLGSPASLPGSVGLTGWSWKNDKCLLRASYEWPDRKPQGWTRAALLRLGLGPEHSIASVRLGADPRGAARDSGGSQPLGKSTWGLGGLCWPGKTPGLSDEVCGTLFVALNFKPGRVTEQKEHQSWDSWVQILALL